MALLQWWQRERKKCLFPQFQAEINEFIHSPNHNPCHINLRCVRYNSTNATDTTLVNCYVIGGLATMNAGTSNDNLIIKSTDYEWTQQYRLWLFFPSSSFLERQQTTDTKKKTVSPHTVDFIVLLQNEGITGLENACPYVASISGGWSVFCVQDRLTCGFEARWVMRL